MSKKIVIVYHSGYGHTAKVAAAVAEGAGASASLLAIDAEGNLPPSYDQQAVPDAALRGRLHLLGAPAGSADAAGATLTLNADVRLHAGRFDGAEQATLALDPARKAYVQVARGRLVVNGLALQAGDALAIEDEPRLDFGQGLDAEVLVFDLQP